MLNYGDYSSFFDLFSDYLNAINHLNLKLFIFVGTLQVLKFKIQKFIILVIRLSEAVPKRPFFRAKNGGHCRMHHTRGRNLRGKYIFCLFDLTD